MERPLYLYLRTCKIEERMLQEAQWMIDNPKISIRQLGREFMISKSQAYRDMQNLKHLNDDLYVQVRNILKSHKTTRF